MVKLPVASIISPKSYKLPDLNKNIVLFFNLEHFFQFREIVKGSKVKSYGPAKRFSFEKDRQPISVLGGMIGAPLSVMLIENSIVSGARNFISFGTAGFIGKNPANEIGKLSTVTSGLDQTGIIADYQGEGLANDFKAIAGYHKLEKIVSVNSVYRLTLEKLESFRKAGADLIDMESCPLNFLINLHQGSYQALFLIIDQIDINNNWINGRDYELVKTNTEKAMSFLYSYF